MFDMNIRNGQLEEISTSRIEQFRNQATLERLIPHDSWRHRIASTLIAWARRLEPEVGSARSRAF